MSISTVDIPASLCQNYWFHPEKLCFEDPLNGEDVYLCYLCNHLALKLSLISFPFGCSDHDISEDLVTNQYVYQKFPVEW